MATYSQWRKLPKLSRIYWLHGPEQTLIDLVISDIRNLVSPGALDDIAVWADSTSPGDLWDKILQQPLVEGTSRLVVVRHAAEIDSFAPLKDFAGELKTQLSNTHVVFAAGDVDSSPALDAVGARRLQVIKCSTPNPDDLVSLVQLWSGLSETSARNLLEWTAGNVTAAWHLSSKIKVMSPKPGFILTKAALSSICDEIPSTFVDSILAADKPRAIAAAESLGASDVPGVCSLLESRLEQVEAVLEFARSGGNLNTARGVPGISYLAAKETVPLVRLYDRARIGRCRGLLAVLDSEARSGAQTGLLEALTALW